SPVTRSQRHIPLQHAFILLAAIALSACGGAVAPASTSSAAPASTAASAKPAASEAAAKPSAASPKPSAAASAVAAASASVSAPAGSFGPVASKPVAPPSDRMKLVYGSPVSPPNMVHMAAYLARDMGFFDDVGLDVEFKEFQGGVDTLRGGISGGLDIVGTSSDPLFAAIQQGAPVKAIGSYAPKLSVSIVAAPDIKTASDLKGRKIGIQEVGGFNEVMARVLLGTVNLKPEDVQYITISTANRVSAL